MTVFFFILDLHVRGADTLLRVFFLILLPSADWNVPGLTIVTFDTPTATYHNWKKKAKGFGQKNKKPPTPHFSQETYCNGKFVRACCGMRGQQGIGCLPCLSRISAPYAVVIPFVRKVSLLVRGLKAFIRDFDSSPRVFDRSHVLF
jgi:hypothetical protein